MQLSLFPLGRGTLNQLKLTAMKGQILTRQLTNGLLCSGDSFHNANRVYFFKKYLEHVWPTQITRHTSWLILL